MNDRKQIKHIGIVGCSAEGTALCYKTIYTESSEYLGNNAHPEVSMHTHSLARYVEYLDSNDLQGVGNLMLSSAEKLKSQGADFLICPDNTIHQAFDYVAEGSPLPWLHIAGSVITAATIKSYRKLGILGTRWLVESDVYPDKLEDENIDWLRPPQEVIERIGFLIMSELVNGIFRKETVEYFQDSISYLKHSVCDAIILGCTEIPLIINDGNSVLPTLNSNRLLAQAAIHKAIAAP
ncbi:aspartate/glutamate racemase family protein [Microbulbifer variabilis]|uniref:aspartate/glutamate racemase family protein n=1 Tax=Microbulbifer variabilis TaxID=266805 RepID=UPI001CFDE204|nr:amino acid racemase [Microbulbifer variabilis]